MCMYVTENYEYIRVVAWGGARIRGCGDKECYLPFLPTSAGPKVHPYTSVCTLHNEHMYVCVCAVSACMWSNT